MSDANKWLPGKFVWFELVTTDMKRAEAFYGEVLGWNAMHIPVGEFTIDAFAIGETMIANLRGPRAAGERSHWVSCVSVDDVDASARTVEALGGKVIEAPADMPGVGRLALITDPQGAEIKLYKSENGDEPDPPLAAPDDPVPLAREGRWMWNELHTNDMASALSFYEKVVGFTHQTMNMGPGNVYHVLSRGGVGRGGMNDHLAPYLAPHWLPYVATSDPDAKIERAKRAGGTIPVPAEDIPGVGRFGVIKDPTGAFLAVMRPQPNMKV